MEPNLREGDRLLVSPNWGGESVDNGSCILFYPVQMDLPNLSDRLLRAMGFPIQSDYNIVIKRVIGKPSDRIRMEDNILFINEEPISIRLESPSSSSLPFFSAGRCREVYYQERIGEEDWIVKHHMSSGTNFLDPLIVPQKGDVLVIYLKEQSGSDSWLMPGNLIDYAAINGELLSAYNFETYYAPLIPPNVMDEIHQTSKDKLSFTFKKNYYFVLGDNRENSNDSRLWGFLAADRIYGFPYLLYFPWDRFQRL